MGAPATLNPSFKHICAGFDYELYNRNDIERILGDKAWCISFKVQQQLAFVRWQGLPLE